MPQRKFTPEQEAEIVRQYLTPLPDGSWLGTTTLARQWGCTQPTIYGALSRAGVARRTIQEAYVNGKRAKPIKNLPPEGELAPACKCGCGESVMWNQRKNRWNVYVDGHYRQDAPYKNPEWLRDAYWTRNLTVAEIALECGAGTDAVFKFIRKFNIPTRDRAASRIGRKAGDKNPAWKGGVTPERQRVYKSQEWISIVKVVYQRDNYVCQRCGSPKHPHAHHIKAWANYPELRLDPDNLITLCEDCHLWVHSKENTNREYIQD